MGAQRIFDLVVKATMAQGRAACAQASGEVDGITITHRPRVRAPDGSCSAIGLVMTDEEYSEALEGRWLARGDLPERLRPYWELLRDLEYAHDEPLIRGGLEAWKRECMKVAHTHGLSVEALGFAQVLKTTL